MNDFFLRQNKTTTKKILPAAIATREKNRARAVETTPAS